MGDADAKLPDEFMARLSRTVSEARTLLVAMKASRKPGSGVSPKSIGRLVSGFKSKASSASSMMSSAVQLVPGLDADAVASSLGCRWDAKSGRLVLL